MMTKEEVIKELESLGFKEGGNNSVDSYTFQVSTSYVMFYIVVQGLWKLHYDIADGSFYRWSADTTNRYDQIWNSIEEDLDIASMIILYGNK